MWRKFLPDSPELADSLEGVGLVLRVQAKLDEAEAMQREALAIRVRRLGADHPDTATAFANLADVFIAKGDYQINSAHRANVRWVRFHNDAPYNSGGGINTLERATDDGLLGALLRFADLRRQRARLKVPGRFPAHFKRAVAA